MEECGQLLLNNTNREKCVLTNWVYSITPEKGWLWTISSSSTSDDRVYSAHSTDGNVGYMADYYTNQFRGVAPSIYLTSELYLLGDGTIDNPFQIVN